MPSAKETTFYIEMMPNTTQDFLEGDVDLLVSRLKDNLRLGGRKVKSSVSQKTRPSPYRVPSRSWADPATYEICGLRNGNNMNNENIRLRRKRLTSGDLRETHHDEADDPYELLQELLRGGSLIKEAVKRLHQNLEELSDSSNDDDEDVEDEDSIFRRKPYYYDEEDEPLPPMYQPLEDL